MSTVCATHGTEHGDLSNRVCINCGRTDCSIRRQSWMCDRCNDATDRALRRERQKAGILPGNGGKT